MTPDDSIADVIAKLRAAAAQRQRLYPTTRFSFRMHWLKQEIAATVDIGRSDPILRHDTAHLMGRHQKDFDAGWSPYLVYPNGFLLGRIREPDGMKRSVEGWWPWDARRN